MESESERKGYPKRKSKKKQRIDRIPVPKQTPPPLSSTDLLALKHSPTDYIPEAPHHFHPLSLSPFRTPQTSRKVVLKKTFCPAPTSSNNKTNAQRLVISRWRPASRVGDWVRKKDGWMDGWMVSVSTIEDLIAYPLTA